MDIKDVEALLVAHLQEAGAIRADLAWLKKAFWVLATANVTFNVTLASSLILYLVQKGK
jgi:hypothetical protein